MLAAANSDWAGAVSDCINEGGHLVYIKSQEIQDDVEFMVANIERVWIGGYQFPESNANLWFWVDGDLFNYTQWATTEPSSNNENCAEILGGIDANPSYRNHWNDRLCTDAQPYLCQYELTSAPTPAPTLASNCSRAGWDNFEGNCYKAFTPPSITWPDAESACVSEGAHLVSIHSIEEQTWLHSMYGKNYYPGLHDVGSNDWAWTDGTPFDFSDWGPTSR